MLPLAEKTGAAVVAVDHVTKGSERNGFAIGSQHKIAGLTGAGYTMEMVDPFGRGRSGKAVIRVGSKDREGYVIGVALEDGADSDGLLVGEFRLDATQFATVDGSLVSRYRRFLAAAQLRYC
jgi:hypothetical protein